MMKEMVKLNDSLAYGRVHSAVSKSNNAHAIPPEILWPLVDLRVNDLALEVVLTFEVRLDRPIEVPSADHDRVELFAA